MLLNLSSLMYKVPSLYSDSSVVPFSSVVTRVLLSSEMHKVPFSVTSSVFSPSIRTSTSPSSFLCNSDMASPASSLISSVSMRLIRLITELSVIKLNTANPPTTATTTASAIHLRCRIFFLYKTMRTINAATVPKRPARESLPTRVMAARTSNMARVALWITFSARTISTSMTGNAIAI